MDNLNPFLPIKSQSGNLVAARYDQNTRTMQIEFAGGRLYEYAETDAAQFAEWEKTFQLEDSSYPFFAANFKKAPCVRVK